MGVWFVLGAYGLYPLRLLANKNYICSIQLAAM